MSGIIDTVGSKSGIVGSDVYPAGHIIQMVQDRQVSGSSITVADDWQPTGLSIAITPRYSSSKILITFSVFSYKNHNQARSAGYKLFKDAALLEERSYVIYSQDTYAGADDGRCTFSYLDSPNTDSEVTYSTQQKSYDSTTSMGSNTYINLMEIKQ